MLVFTGATGGVGGQAARLLADEGHDLRLLARDPTRLSDFPNCEVVKTDYLDRDGLARGMRPGDVVFMVSINLAHDERMRLHTSFVEAATAAKVAHVVYLSFISAGPKVQFLHGLAHWETEEFIRKSGVPYTFLRTSFYDTVTTMFYLNGLALGPAGQGAVAWVSRPDCAAAVAAVMRDPVAHRGMAYDINGPEALTLTETSRLITELTGLPYRYVDADYDPVELAKTVDAPLHFLTHRRTAFLGIAAGEFATNKEDLYRLTGTRGTTLREFIEKNRGGYPKPTAAN
jgi:uncharacterized protein YbjT (DUF2867 family)